jgi:hypothetical protein
MPEEFYNVAELLVRFSDQPVNELRDFAFRFAEQMDGLPTALARGDRIVIEEKVTFTIPDSSVTEFNIALERIKDKL